MSRFSGWRSTPPVTLRNSYPSNHEDEDIFPALGEGVILNNADFTYQITDGENLVQSHQINHECKHHPGNRRGGGGGEAKTTFGECFAEYTHNKSKSM